MLPTFNAKGDWVLSERLSVFSQTIRTGVRACPCNLLSVLCL